MVWICKLCGYRHEGTAAPESCPLCGAAASEFELESGGGSGSPDGGGGDTAAAAGASAGTPGASANASAGAAGSAPPSGGADRRKAVSALTYGLYVVTARAAAGGQAVDNGQTANTCFQITAEPLRVALGINKNNYTHGLIAQSGAAGLTVLHEGNIDLVRNFGYSSGRDRDKFAGLSVWRSPAGILYPAGALASLETRVLTSMDAGTHTLFLCEVTDVWYFGGGAPMTYAWFLARKRG